MRELTGGRGADIVIEAAGHVSAFTEGLEMVAPFGRYLIMGLYSGKTQVPINPVAINNRNLTIIGSLGYPRSALAETVAIASELGEKLDFAALIGGRFPLAETEQAIAAAARGDVIKAVVVP